MAAALAFSLAMNHPFLDGNKRTALMSAVCFLYVNGYFVDPEKEPLDDVMVHLVAGKLSQSELATFLKSAAKKL